MKERNLELGLLGLGKEVGHEEVSDLVGGLVEVEAHPLSTEMLADDVELEARKRENVSSGLSYFQGIVGGESKSPYLFSLIIYAIPNPSSMT